MTIVPINKKGSLTLPPEVSAQFMGIAYFEVKVNTRGITLSPILITSAAAKPKRNATASTAKDKPNLST